MRKWRIKKFYNYNGEVRFMPQQKRRWFFFFNRWEDVFTEKDAALTEKDARRSIFHLIELQHERADAKTRAGKILGYINY